jgi:hypothetical protein
VSGRDPESDKTHPQRDCRAGHGPARVAEDVAKGAFFHASVSLPERMAFRLLSRDLTESYRTELNVGTTSVPLVGCSGSLDDRAQPDQLKNASAC